MNVWRRALVDGLLAWVGMVAGQAVEGAAPIAIGVRCWSVVGPYPSSAESDLDRPFPPEASRDFAREVPGPDQDTWLRWGGAAPGNELHLPAAPQQQHTAETPAIAYAVTYLEVPVACRVRLAVSSAAAYRTWLDGTAIMPEATVDLSAGIHELLVKQRPCRPSDTLCVTAEGPAALRYLPQRPWPLRQVPAATWRGARPSDPTALRQRLGQAGGLGFPDLPGCEWTAPATLGDHLQVAGSPTLFLVGHVFFPVKYHLQEYRVRLHGLLPAAVLLDGKAMSLTREGVDTASFTVASHALQPGFNRIAVEVSETAGGTLGVTISDPGDLKFAAEVPAQLDPTRPGGDWPAATISNGLVTARLALPDDEKGLYRSNRFERAGIIANLDYKGHSFFVGVPAAPNPLDAGICYGPSEEWFEALAWRDAHLGEPFLKMGVGLFERPAHPLHMWYCSYWPQTVLPWTSRIDGGTAEFTQTLDGPRGWGYRYTKRLVLEPGRPVLRIEHTLVNTGSHVLDGTQYNHNFIRLDDHAPQAGYRCDFAFAPRLAKEFSTVARVEGNAVILTAAPAKPGGSDLTGWSDPQTDQGFTVSCAGTPAKIRIDGSAPWSKFFLFFHPDYLATEPFVRITVAPGATASWTRTYTFIVE